MNTRHTKLITAGLAAALVVPAFALEAPADDAPPPAQAAAPATTTEPASLPTFKLPPDTPPDAVPQETAFLGVVSAEVPGFLAEHLGLAAGQGVLVRALCPDSPAGKSGIAVNDVIIAVAGKAVHAQADLSREITRNKPGDTVALEIIHKGKPTTVSVVLANKPADLAATGPTTLDQLNLDNLPQDMADHIRDALGGMDLSLKLGQGLDADMDLPPDIEDAIAALQKRMLGGGAMLDQILPPTPVPGASAQTQSSATFRMMDTDGSVEVTSTNGSKDVTVRDINQEVVWSGPWNTDRERAAAPEEVRRRMGSLNLDTGSTGAGLKFNFNRQATDPDH
jgi:serine protease Do